MAEKFDAYTGVITTKSGKDVKSTDQLSGEATPSAAFKQKNVTKVYTNSEKPSGPFGGKPSRQG